MLPFALLDEVGELGSQELSGHFEVVCIADSIEGLRSGGWEWEYRTGGMRRLAGFVGCVCYRRYGSLLPDSSVALEVAAMTKPFQGPPGQLRALS